MLNRLSEYIWLHKIHQVEELVSKILKTSIVAIYTKGKCFYIILHDLCYFFDCSASDERVLLGGDSMEITFNDFITLLKPVLESSNIHKICINAKELLNTCKKYNVFLKTFDDVAVMAYSIETAAVKHYDLQYLVSAYLGDKLHHPCAILELYKVLQDKIVQHSKLVELTMNGSIQGSNMHGSKSTDSQQSIPYHLVKLNLSIYECIDKPLISVLSDMERKGIMIDTSVLSALESEFSREVFDLEMTIYKLAGERFNISSPKQLSDVLFSKLGIEGGKKSAKTHTYSTSADILDKLAAQGYEIASKVMKWRQLTKLLNTYIVALQKNINVDTGRVHSTFEMTVTATARLSSRNPNLQNIPIKTEEGGRIRKAFVAASGNVLVSADYSQIELRLLAHMANVSALKEAFMSDVDIHTLTASQIFHIPIEEVTPVLRRRAKGINFGIIYGISAFGLAQYIDSTPREAELYMKQYLQKYVGIRSYMDRMVSIAKAQGRVYTIFGRECHIRNIRHENYALRTMAERASINAPIQASASEVIKKAMVELPHEVRQYMILQVHDELLFEVPKDEVESVTKIIRSCMENAVQLSVPMQVNIKTGFYWQ